MDQEAPPYNEFDVVNEPQRYPRPNESHAGLFNHSRALHLERDELVGAPPLFARLSVVAPASRGWPRTPWPPARSA